MPMGVDRPQHKEGVDPPPKKVDDLLADFDSPRGRLLENMGGCHVMTWAKVVGSKQERQ